MENYYSELKQYIDDSIKSLSQLKDESLTSEQRTVVIYEMYSNFHELEQECKNILKDIRGKFKLKHQDVMRWLESQYNEDEKNN
jgi:hypothetical protein